MHSAGKPKLEGYEKDGGSIEGERKERERTRELRRGPRDRRERGTEGQRGRQKEDRRR
jgi:hypothetical protein